MRKPDLPIFEIERSLLKTLTTQKRLVLTAPTGSGKSTQVPQMLLDSGLLRNGQVTVLQPRRLPTRMLAAWVAQARDVRLGGEVGYQMRLDNVTSPATRIRYVTEGVLLRQMLADHDLKGVSAIIFDATLSFSCPGRMRSLAPCRRRATRSARSSSCFHCTANYRRSIRTRRSLDMTGAKSSLPQTSRKPRSLSTAFAW